MPKPDDDPVPVLKGRWCFVDGEPIRCGCGEVTVTEEEWQQMTNEQRQAKKTEILSCSCCE